MGRAAQDVDVRCDLETYLYRRDIVVGQEPPFRCAFVAHERALIVT